MTWVAGNRITAQRMLDNQQRVISFDTLVTNSATTTTTEAIALTTNSITFRNNRAYRITVKCLGQCSVEGDNQISIKVRRTGLAGTPAIDQWRSWDASANNANIPIFFEDISVNTTGADITDVLVLTYARVGGAGTGTALITATTGNVAYIQVEDIGDASEYPSAQAI